LDDIALNETMQKIRNRTCLVLLTNGINLSVEPQKLQLRINKVEIVENPFCQFCNYSSLAMKLQRKGLNVAIEKIPEDKVKLMLQNKIRVMERKILMLKRMGANVTDLEEKLNEVKELINQNRYQDAYRVMVQLQGEQMAKVKLHLHPMGHGVAKGKAPHANHQNGNNSQMGVASHVYHQNVNNTQMGNANAPHLHNKDQ
jgi:putative cell wall-binding protein